MQVVADIYPHAHIMHRFPTREQRSKPKSHITPIYSTRPRSLSAISLLQPSQIHARASSVVRKVLGARSPLKEPVLFGAPTERNSCDKPRSSADSTRRGGSRPRSNTTPTEITWPKDVTTPPANHDTFSATPCTSGPTQTAPVNSLLFSPTPSTPSSDDQEMESTQTSPKRPSMTQGSPEIDSGYASGQSSAAGSALPPTNNSPVIARTPQTLGKIAGAPLTPGGMNMRLSPSLPRSIMPMPILNLPPLPPTPVRDHTLPRARSLHPEEMRHVKKSMPALMRHGTSNMAVTHAEEDDDDGSSDGSDSDSSDAEETTPDGESSPDAHDSIDESIEESTSHSGSEADYFDARETHTPAAADDLSGLATPRASDQHRTLGETSALGLQITPTPGPSTITGSSPWTMVDVTPGVDRAASGHPPRTDYFSHPIASARQALKSPHRTPRVSQLISLASPRANGRSPQATTTPLPPPNTIAARRARAATVLRDPNGESPRPALYQQVSQSMMNLTSPPSERTTLTGLDDLRAPYERMPTIAATPGTPAPPATPLMRRNSMPTMIKHPPSYNELYSSVPREEEGKEKLPGYSCGIHIEAMMPRKMEFSAPGVLAKDRGWKKQYIVIHGTSLMVYKYDIRKVPIGGKVKGKEKYEGVVTEDEVDLNSPTVHLPGHESAAARVPLNPPTRRASRRAASVGTSDNGSRSSLLSRFHGNSSRSAVSQPQETPVPAPDDKASVSESTVSISASNSTSASNRRWSHNQASVPFASSLPHFNPPFSSGNQLIRQYTLQRAESGLGSDYYKRRNVIRVRCEGEQFLLQAENVMQVVDWIECLQAGTNTALDLDERPMTKPPPFPRRRRRRRARPADGSNANGASGASNTNDNTPSR